MERQWHGHKISKTIIIITIIEKNKNKLIVEQWK